MTGFVLQPIIVCVSRLPHGPHLKGTGYRWKESHGLLSRLSLLLCFYLIFIILYPFFFFPLKWFCSYLILNSIVQYFLHKGCCALSNRNISNKALLAVHSRSSMVQSSHASLTSKSAVHFYDVSLHMDWLWCLSDMQLMCVLSRTSADLPKTALCMQYLLIVRRL